MKSEVILIISVVVIISISILAIGLIAYLTDEWVEVYVKDKERITESQSGKYLIFTDKEVFENTDSILYWKFNSSDFYSEIEKEQTYKFRVYGFRIPFLSWYRNIIEIIPQS